MGCGNTKPSQFEGNNNVDMNQKFTKPQAVPKLKIDIVKLQKEEQQLKKRIDYATFSDEEDLASNRGNSNYNSVTERLKQNQEKQKEYFREVKVGDKVGEYSSKVETNNESRQNLKASR